MAPVKLYMMENCPNCRAVFMCARALQADIAVTWVDIVVKKETRTPEFEKMNPLHSVPTMDDNGFYLAESRAIAMYLANNHSTVESVYPKHPQKRAKVDSFLFYDVTTVYKTIRDLVYPQFVPVWPSEISPDALPNVRDLLDKFEQIFLKNSDYLVGDHVTLADLSVCASVTLLDPVDFDFTPWSRLSAWLSRLRALPYFDECNKRGLEMTRDMMKAKKARLQQQKQ